MRSAFWKIRSGLQSLVLQEGGQDLVEYSLLLLLVATAMVVSMGSLATALVSYYASINSHIPH
jgi:Flp pilus assembly pilin Flp